MFRKKMNKTVSEIQNSWDYEHRPGIKNADLKIVRKFEFQFFKYFTQKINGVYDQEALVVIKMKLEEAKIKYDYYKSKYSEK